MQGSHVMRFGQLSMQNEKAGDYEGTKNDGSRSGGVRFDGRGAVGAAAGRKQAGSGSLAADEAPVQRMPQRDADLAHLRWVVMATCCAPVMGYGGWSLRTCGGLWWLVVAHMSNP